MSGRSDFPAVIQAIHGLNKSSTIPSAYPALWQTPLVQETAKYALLAFGGEEDFYLADEPHEGATHLLYRCDLLDEEMLSAIMVLFYCEKASAADKKKFLANEVFDIVSCAGPVAAEIETGLLNFYDEVAKNAKALQLSIALMTEQHREKMVAAGGVMKHDIFLSTILLNNINNMMLENDDTAKIPADLMSAYLGVCDSYLHLLQTSNTSAHMIQAVRLTDSIAKIRNLPAPEIEKPEEVFTPVHDPDSAFEKKKHQALRRFKL